VVHINAGIAGLVACIMVGKRKGFPGPSLVPHNVPFVLIGAALLWVGWFGFNAGSALGMNGKAVMAFSNTHIATGAAAFSWFLVEWLHSGKPTVLGILSGMVAGLVAIGGLEYKGRVRLYRRKKWAFRPYPFQTKGS